MAYMTMQLPIRNKLEQAGIEVISHPFDFRTKTDMAVRLPNGQTLEYYDYLFQIPSTLYNGEEVSLGEGAIPTETPIYTSDTGSCSDASCATLYDGDNPLSAGNEQGLIAPAVIALIIFLVKLVAIFMVVYMLLAKALHPCGSVASHIEIDDCIKVITYPNCQTDTVDSCYIDPDTGEIHPKIISSTGAPLDVYKDIIIWSIVGVVAIAGVYLAVKILSRPKGTSRPELPPRDTTAYGIDYIQ